MNTSQKRKVPERSHAPALHPNLLLCCFAALLLSYIGIVP
jgi:hypothetical protein